MNRRKQDKWGAIARIVNDVRFMLPMVIVLFGGTAYNFEAVRSFVNGGDPLPEVGDNIDVPIQPGVHPEVRQKIETIIAQLNSMKKEISRLNANSQKRDATLREDVDYIKGLVQ